MEKISNKIKRALNFYVRTGDSSNVNDNSSDIMFGLGCLGYVEYSGHLVNPKPSFYNKGMTHSLYCVFPHVTVEVSAYKGILDFDVTFRKVAYASY